MWQFTWKVKASKLCNLRCRYCYEWPHLADPARIPPDGWRRILAAAKEYHLRQTGGEAAEGMTGFVWHGGEPLALPISYWRCVIGLQREALGGGTGGAIPYQNAAITNLYMLTPAYLDLFEQERVHVNVSFDGAPGTRVTRQDHPTEDRVIENMWRLRERKIRFSASVVLAGHSKDCLIATYDLLRSAGACHVTVNPLLPVDHFSDDAPFTISVPEVVKALQELYIHWSSDRQPTPVSPLTGYLRTASLHGLNLPSPDFDRSASGERRLTVDTGGDLYVRAIEFGGERRVGNVFSQTLSEILQSVPYTASLERDKLRRAHVCGTCVYRQACDTRPALEAAGEDNEGRCPVAAQLCDFISARLASADGWGEIFVPQSPCGVAEASGETVHNAALGDLVSFPYDNNRRTNPPHTT